MRIILASKSPRRKEILTQMGLEFEIVTSEFDENVQFLGDREKYLSAISRGKAEEVLAKTQGDRIIISADTVVFCDNKIFGKPKNREDAIGMLQAYQKENCIVATGMTVMCVKDNNIETHYEYSDAIIEFQSMTLEEMNEYIDTNEPMDKAGAFAIQGKGGQYIKKISGDYYCVVGLSINKLYNVLKKIHR